MQVYELTSETNDELTTKVAELYMQQISIDDDVESYHLAMNAIQLILQDQAHSRIVIAEAEGTILGVAFLNIGVSPRVGGRYIWLNELYVHNEYRNKGIGKKLLLYIIHKAEADGVKSIELETGVNNSVTKHIYQSMGFYEIVSKRYGFTF